MAKVKLTKTAVDSLTAADRKAFLWDTALAGFGLYVSPTGSKTYVYQFRMGGRESKTRRYTIGRHGSPWTVETARKKAQRIALLVGQGIDPILAEQERRRLATDLAFKTYVDLFVDGYLKLRWKRWQDGKRVLLRNVVPVIGSRPITALNRADFNPIWDKLRDRPSVNRLTFATVRKLLRWAANRGDIERSPLEGMEAPHAVPARDRVLSDAELRLVWNAVKEEGPLVAAFYQLLILTGQRRGEVAGLAWDEVDRDEAMWTLPRSRSKNGIAHTVPLTQTAIRILDAVAGSECWPQSGRVICHNGTSEFSGFSKAKLRLDERIAAAALDLGKGAPKEWRVHDLRRTFATNMQRLGVRFEVTEALLNHLSGAKGGIAGIYQRYHWSTEKREALNAWDELLEKIVSDRRPLACPNRRDSDVSFPALHTHQSTVPLSVSVNWQHNRSLLH